MRVALTIILLVLPSSAVAAEQCAPVPSVERAGPVYVLMFGFPHDTRGNLPRLHMVGHDLLQMSTFFGALGPDRVWIHGEPKASLVERFGEALAPPTWRALESSIDEVSAALDAADGRATVYLYFVGHGERTRAGEKARGEVYALREPGNDEPGFDGIISSRLLTESVLEPLARRADVHLIVDACRSYYLLARGMKRQGKVIRNLPAIDLETPFKSALPTVGAVLATNGDSATTMEDETFGGLFSHAVRTGALGAADFDADGVVTYGELRALMAWILMPNGIRPTVVTPGVDEQRPFIDWRQTSAARVCVSPRLAGRRTLSTGDGIFATLQVPESGMTVWLEPGSRYRFAGDRADDAVGFVAAAGPLAVDRAPYGEHRGIYGEAPFARPYDAEVVQTWLADPGTPVGGWYLGVGLVGHVGRLGIRGGEPEIPVSPGADLGGRIGRGRHRLVGDLTWARLDLTSRRGFNTVDRPVPVIGHSVGGRLGYGLLLYEGPWELAAEALVGGGVWQDDDESVAVPEAVLRIVGARPFDPDPRWALRTDLQIGAMLMAGGETAPFVRLGVGVEYETFVE